MTGAECDRLPMSLPLHPALLRAVPTPAAATSSAIGRHCSCRHRAPQLNTTHAVQAMWSRPGANISVGIPSAATSLHFTSLTLPHKSEGPVGSQTAHGEREREREGETNAKKDTIRN
jgi:hypothetical protein